MQVVYLLLAMVAAYLIGSLSFAVIVSRAAGLDDPRRYGSGNPGATNVLRSGHKGAAVATLVLDALKGAVPVLLVKVFGPRIGLADDAAAFVGLAAFAGHLWPLFFGFNGGKGVATAAGVLLALNWQLGLLALATWLVVAVALRYSSLASLVAAITVPFYQALIWGVEPGILALIGMSLLLIWRHQANIGKLLAGTESKLGQKAGAPAVGAAARDKTHKAAPAQAGTGPHGGHGGHGGAGRGHGGRPAAAGQGHHPAKKGHH